MNAHQHLDAFKPEKVEEDRHVADPARDDCGHCRASQQGARSLCGGVRSSKRRQGDQGGGVRGHARHPGTNSYNSAHADETKAFFRAVQLPDRAQYLRTAKKIIDIDAWSWIIERTDLERLMDHEAKETLRNQMAYVPDRVDRTPSS
jgi:hypothetical protein